MKIIKNELLMYIDVDETLIFSCTEDTKGSLATNYYNTIKYVKPHKKHINFLKSLKTRGYYIIVHSANGWRWALEIVKLLQLEPFIHEVKAKPIKYLDDRPCEEWFGQRVYLEDK